MLVHWIWFAHRPGLNDRDKMALLQHFRDPEDIYFADDGAFDAIGLSEDAKTALREKNLTSAEEILEACDREKLHILTCQDAAYPARLKNIADPPVVLYYKGRLPDFDGSPVIGVVGTRKASAYGIDGMAMSGALTAGAPAVGVLGCGADIVYPISNRALFRDTEEYGCILSEFAPGTPPAKWTFPKRNRIISGLSCGVLVVEAPEKSGALITARLAAEQGRDVFAVPGNIDQPSFVGSNRLLRDGAIMVSSGWDVLSEYEALFPDKIRKEDAPAHQTAYPDEVRKAAEAEKPLLKVAQKLRLPRKNENLKKDLAPQGIDKTPCAPYSDVGSVRPKLSPEEQTIVDALSGGQRLVDDVIAETGLSTGKLLSSLTMLELKGIIKRLPGKRIVLSGK